MKTLNEVVKFLEDYVIECNPDDGCGRCNEARECVESLKAIAERMPTEKDAIRYAADYATESEEPHTDIEKMDTFLHGTRWFRSRMEEKK
jgi:hypothetical protein